MSEVTLLIRVKLKLPGSKDYFDSEERAKKYVIDALQSKNAVKSIEILRTESILTV